MSSDPKLKYMRGHIDEADKDLLDALKERMKWVDEIGKYKNDTDKPIPDPERRGEVISTNVSRGRDRGLDAGFVRELFEMIMAYSEKREGK